MTEPANEAWHAVNPPPPPEQNQRARVIRVLQFLAPWRGKEAREAAATDLMALIEELRKS